MNLMLISAAATLGLFAQSEAASARGPSSVPPVVASAAVAPATVGSPGTRYCVINQVTGSRLTRKTCQTRAQWQAQGFDPLAKR